MARIDVKSSPSIHNLITYHLLEKIMYQSNKPLKSGPLKKDESAFDWDLSDRTDTETQTNPPTRATSTNNEGGTAGGGVAPPQEWNDAIVQTDQRLTFLLHRTTEIKVGIICLRLWRRSVAA